MKKCPYCGYEGEFEEPVSLLKGGMEELLKMGITVPMIQKCPHCKATLSPRAFDPHTEEYKAAYAAVRR